MKQVYINGGKNYIELSMCDDKKRGIAIIVPGGGYDHTSIREGSFVAEAFNNKGYHALIVRYRETLDLYPTPMEEVMWAIDYARNLDCVDKNKVILIGFSAGAHLCGLVSNNYMNYKNYDAKPNADILCYPVIASDKDFTHKGSIKYLLGEENINEDNLKKVDIALNCHKDFPPTFMWHTVTDESVSCYNSLYMVEALKKNNIKFEYHLFPEGVHGMSLATKECSMDDPRKHNEYVSRWFDMALQFVDEILK